MADRTQKENTAMAGELLAWLSEKRGWDDEDKLCVTAGALPVLMVNFSKDKETFDKTKQYILNMLDGICEATWKIKRGS